MTCPACGKEFNPRHASPAGEGMPAVCPNCFERFISGWVPDAAEDIADADRLDGKERYAMTDPTVPKMVRTKDGQMAHRADCHWGWRGVPWRWAEGRTVDEVLGGTLATGVKFCEKCRPLDIEGRP